MRSSAPYTRAMLRGSHRGKGYNSTSAPLNRIVTTNTKHLRLCCLPSPQPADIPSADILFMDILFTSQIKTLKEEKVNIVKDLLYKWG